MAIFLTGFFGLGMALKTMIQGNSAYSSASQAGLDNYIFGQASYLLEADLHLIGIVSVVSIALLLIFYKELKVYIFDPDYAKVTGIPIMIIDIVVLVMTILVISVGIKTIGTILISSFLIMPTVSANQWNKSFSKVLLLGVIFAEVAAFEGNFVSSIAQGLSTGPSIILFSGLDTVDVFGLFISYALIKMSTMLAVNLLFIALFFCELKISSFDTEFAHLVGIKTGLIFYALMCLTSFTSVIAFDSVGSILVISFFISSAATALLLARSLLSALVLSGAIGCFNSLIGYLIAIRLNTSMSGTVAFVAMVSYMALLLFAKEGAFTKAIRRAKDKRTLVYDALLVHLGGHTEKARFSPENNVDEIIHHINWEPAKLNKVTSRMQMKGYIMIVDNYYLLTEKGKKRYQALKSLLLSS